MPGMLGWFQLTTKTTLEDIEWMLAKSAGYDAGFALFSNYQFLEKNGFTEEILHKIKIWEQARMLNIFDKKIKNLLRNTKKEFHLEKLNDKEWILTLINPSRLEHTKKVRQPGEPVCSKMIFSNPAKKQDLSFILSVFNGDVNDIKIEIDGYKEIVFPVVLKDGETLKFMGERAILFNENGKKIKELKTENILLKAGEHSITLDCNFIKGDKAKLKLETRLIERIIKVKQ
jgi:hypothetical protein